MKMLLCFGLSLILTTIVSAKDFPKVSDAPVKLTKSEQKKIDKANELIKNATALWKEVSLKYNPEEKTVSKSESQQAMPVIRKAAGLFLEANYMKYEVYHKNCVEFWSKNSNASGLANARKFQKDANNYLEKAQSNRRAAENYINDFSTFYARFYEAISLEIIAVKKEGRALQYYQDWPVHFAYEFDDDIEVDLFDPNVKKEEPKKQIAIAPVEIPKEVKPVEVKPKEEPKVIPDSLIIFYKVQIAAHTVRMTDKYLRDNFYKGTMKIDELHEDGWYKYTIGYYKTEEEASKLLREVKIPKAFVVAYKNGKRVPLKEANGSAKRNK